MASSSIPAALPILPSCNSNIFSKPKPSVFSLPPNVSKLPTLTSRHSSRVFAAPELLESEEAIDTIPDGLDSATFEVGGSETPGTSQIAIGADVDKMAPKQKIRIKLRSYWVPLIEDSCKQIMDAAKTTNAKTMGPVPLPTKKRIYCVLKSPHVHKDARFHFEIRTHQRLIDILYPTAQTIDSLMQLDLPAGVDVEVKL
ncbi:Ribosomal protein S10 [Macleaya cordata]|uniref:Small ribosomal subunit protein uS10c n=1 Tax=Macleaya cordata TaxID=56857 RepID=A0A200RBV8_MACCD|nr:Ribosomal protein S10 [Macleaya cordata]